MMLYLVLSPGKRRRVVLNPDSQYKMSNFMIIDIQIYCVNVRSLSVSNSLYCSSTVIKEQEQLHPNPNAVSRVQGEKSKSLPNCNSLCGSSTVKSEQEPLHPRLNVLLNRLRLPHSIAYEN